MHSSCLLLVFVILVAVTAAYSGPVNVIHFGGNDGNLAEPGQPQYYLLADVDTSHDSMGDLRRTQRSFWKKLLKNTGLDELFGDEGCTNCCSNNNNYNNGGEGYDNLPAIPPSPFDPSSSTIIQPFNPFEPLRALQPLLINPLSGFSNGLAGAYGYNPLRPPYGGGYGPQTDNGYNNGPNFNGNSGGNSYQSNNQYSDKSPAPSYGGGESPTSYNNQPDVNYDSNADNGTADTYNVKDQNNVDRPVENEPVKYGDEVDEYNKDQADNNGESDSKPTNYKEPEASILNNGYDEQEQATEKTYKPAPNVPQIVYQPIIYVSPQYQATPIQTASHTKDEEVFPPAAAYSKESPSHESSVQEPCEQPYEAPYDPPAPEDPQIMPDISEIYSPAPQNPQQEIQPQHFSQQYNSHLPSNCGNTDQSYHHHQSSLSVSPIVAPLYNSACNGYNLIPAIAAVAVPAFISGHHLVSPHHPSMQSPTTSYGPHISASPYGQSHNTVPSYGTSEHYNPHRVTTVSTIHTFHTPRSSTNSYSSPPSSETMRATPFVDNRVTTMGERSATISPTPLTLADQPYRACPELFANYHQELARNFNDVNSQFMGPY